MAKAEFSADVIASDSSLLGIGSQFNMVTVDVAAKELFTGVAALAGRASLVITSHPDNTGYVFIGLDNTVSTAKCFIVLQAGSGITAKMDPKQAVKVWAIGSAAGQKVCLLEGK